MKKLIFTFALLALLISEPVFAKKKGYVVTTVANGGSISGSVILKGKVPNPEVFAVAKNPEVCGTEDREVKWVEAGANNGLKNMVVYLHKVKKGKDWNDKKDILIDQKNCQFNPWLRVVPKGVGVTVKNSDAALHNIHIRNLKGVKPGKVGRKYRPIKKTMFNEGQPPGSGDIKTKIKAKLKGNFIRINCEAHNFMFAWMFAADNPYVVTTNDDGSFKIDNIPAGKYKLRAWHPTLGLLQKKLNVKAGGDVSHKFVFKSK